VLVQAPSIGHEYTWWPAVQNAFVREAGGEPHAESYGERYVKDEVKKVVRDRAKKQLEYMRTAEHPWGGPNQKRKVAVKYKSMGKIFEKTEQVEDPLRHPTGSLLVSDPRPMYVSELFTLNAHFRKLNEG